MKKLLLKRFYIGNVNTIKTFFIYTLVTTISLCFSMLLLVIYDNAVTPFNQTTYDYKIYWFDKNTIEVLKKNERIKELYYTGKYEYDFYHNNISASVEINYVPYWDSDGITYFSENRKIKGKISNKENSIMIDALLAHELRVDIGDVVYVDNNGKRVPFIVSIIIEPIKNEVSRQAICVCNNYVKDNMGVSKKNVLCSQLFLKTDGSKEVEEYLFYELMPPGYDNLTKEEIYEINIVAVEKKEWEIEYAKGELENTPPVTFCISMLALIIIFIFVLREATSQKINADKDIAILESIGMKRREILPVTMIGQEMIIVPAVIISSILVKIIYDELITNQYLSYRLVLIESIVLLIVSSLICLIVSIIVVNKNKKKSICELLNAE